MKINNIIKKYQERKYVIQKFREKNYFLIHIFIKICNILVHK